MLQIRNMTTVYPTGRGHVRAVNGVNLVLEEGKVLGLVGESGCGKSTVLLSILGLVRPPGQVAEGEILFKGRDMREMNGSELRAIRGKEIAMIFQDPLSTLNPVFPVGEQIRETLRLHHIMEGGYLPWPFDRNTTRKERERVLKVMAEVGIPSPDNRYAAYPHQFSGGMQQRALIAIALSCNPTLLLADEPTTALDVTIQAQILDLMRQINQEHGTAVILVTHDLGVAAEFCDSIVVMYAGRIVERGSVEQIVENPQHPYTRGLLACRPQITIPKSAVAPIPGNVPDLADLIDGCPFAPRCLNAKDVCSEGPVPQIEVLPGHLSRCLMHYDYQREVDWTWSDRIELDSRTANTRIEDARN
ncbi:MAG: ABC transporter ATP-binding protein [Anaerolineaceae bacterium]|nr:ABC transporter ATP-binding protein [Anaerolineaceae bacterium]